MSVRIGLVPSRRDVDTDDALERCRCALERSLGVCRVRRFSSPEHLAAAFDGDEVDLVWSSPTLALLSPALRDGVPVANAVRQGTAAYHGVLFVARTSTFPSVLALRGARAAWVSPSSAAGYLFPRIALASSGVELEGFFAEESFLGSHGAVAEAVACGDADVGATFAIFEHGDATRPLVRSGFLDDPTLPPMRVLLASAPIPADLWIATPALHAAYGGRLRRALADLCVAEPGPVMRVFGAEAYVPCERRGLEDLRRQLEDARALDLAIPP